MALTEGWKRRLEGWQNAIAASVYRPLSAVDVEGFITTEQLSPEEALRRAFKPMPAGTPWGAKWEYGWFKTSLTLPQEAAGQRIVFAVYSVYNPMPDWGLAEEEAVVWVNGKEVGALDFGHREITLALNGQPGAKYDILMEVYAGHGVREVGGGPAIYGREMVPEPGPTQLSVHAHTLGIWREDVYQLAIDYIALLNTRNVLDQSSLRVAEIDRGLMDATYAIDMELPEAEMLASVKAGRAILKPLLEAVNGSTAPTMFTFGHGHLDIEWLWPLAETERKMARTVGTQLTLMEEYPEYRFLQSQPHLMRMLKNLYPDVYERFKAAVKSGNMIIEGGMWVEADTNITGGESLIRQFIHGKRYMQAEFGVESKILWLPDVFGYSGALPQIMAGCGVTGFMTSKIFWAYNGADPFPYNNFIWEGIDGSTVLAGLYNGYGHFPLPNMIFETWRDRAQKNDIAALVYPIGWGDGGGGATRSHLEFARRTANLEGIPRLRMAGPTEYFEDLLQRGPVRNRYVGELYFQAHRGTYTTQAKTKRGNRKSELALREAEIWASAARALKGFAFGPMRLDEDWKLVLLHQFHDGLPGSSIQRVYAEIERDHTAVIGRADALAQEAASCLLSQSTSMTVFNSLSWARRTLTALPAGAQASGTSQVAAGQTYVETDVPALGYAPAGQTASAAGPVSATSRSLENEFLRAEFNGLGEITRLLDKETGREITAGPANVFKMYKDVPVWFDAWDIDPQYVETPVELSTEASLDLEASGPLFGQLKLTRKLSELSSLSQTIRLRRGSRRLDFETVVEWQESHKLLKVCFPVDIHANEAIHEIQFGHLSRPNHASRPFDADRFEVSNHKWSALAEANRGAAVLNDSKFGLNVLGNSINLTLLKSSLAPDMTADKGTQTFSYGLYAWNGPFSTSGVVQEAYDLNVPANAVSGSAEKAVSLFSLDQPNIIIEAVKPAEDGSSAIVLRLYESMHAATGCTLSTSLPVKSAAQTDMLENNPAALTLSSGRITLDFRPFEIKTVRLDL